MNLLLGVLSFLPALPALSTGARNAVSKVLSSTNVTTGFPPFAAIQGCVAQIALEM